MRILAALLFVSCLVSPAFAFDGERRGFMLGLGIGGGVTSLEDQYGHGVRDLKDGGISTDFEIGKGVRDPLLVYYANRVIWLTGDTRLGLTGLGIRRYLRADQSNAVFGDVTLGLSSWSGRLGDTLGVGASIAAGWEPIPHWLVRASAIYGDSGLRETYFKPRGSAGTLSVEYLAY